MLNPGIYLGDNRQLFQQLDDNSVDLIMTSPPYDNNRHYTNDLEWTFDVFKTVAKEIARVLKPHAVCVWNVNDQVINNTETLTSFKQALYFKEECGLNMHDTMIWQKPNFAIPGTPHKRYHQIFEYMFVLSKGYPKTFNPIRDRPNKQVGNEGVIGNTTSVRNPNGTMNVRPNRHKIIQEFGYRHNIWFGNTVSMNRPCKANEHPAQYPLWLPRDHIITWTNEGDLVVDPFLGSGTTGIAAKQLNRQFIGFEISQQYYELAKRTIEKNSVLGKKK